MTARTLPLKVLLVFVHLQQLLHCGFSATTHLAVLVKRTIASRHASRCHNLLRFVSSVRLVVILTVTLLLQFLLELLLLLLGQAISVDTLKQSTLFSLWNEQTVVINDKLRLILVFASLFHDLAVLDNFTKFVVSQRHDCILRFEISVNDLADSMQIIKAYEHLLRNSSNQRYRNTFVVVAFHDL